MSETDRQRGRQTERQTDVVVQLYKSRSLKLTLIPDFCSLAQSEHGFIFGKMAGYKKGIVLILKSRALNLCTALCLTNPTCPWVSVTQGQRSQQQEVPCLLPLLYILQRRHMHQTQWTSLSRGKPFPQIDTEQAGFFSGHGLL